MKEGRVIHTEGVVKPGLELYTRLALEHPDHELLGCVSFGSSVPRSSPVRQQIFTLASFSSRYGHLSAGLDIHSYFDDVRRVVDGRHVPPHPAAEEYVGPDGQRTFMYALSRRPS